MKVLLLYESTTPPKRAAVAVRLDKDFVAQGDTPKHAFERLETQIRVYDRYMQKEPESRPLPPTPLVYHKLYGLSAVYDGAAPAGWDVRVWYGKSPFQWAYVGRGKK